MLRAWALLSAALAMTSLSECNASSVNLDGLAIFFVVALVVLGLPVVLCAVVLVMNVVVTVTGKGSVGWGSAGLVFGSLALLVAAVCLGLESSEDVTIVCVSAFSAAPPLLLLGWRNVKKGKQREALMKQIEAAKPPKPPPQEEPEPPRLAPPWP
jgi:hypothetical protein